MLDRIKYTGLGMIVVFGLSLLGFAFFNAMQSQYYQYQERQEQNYFRTVSGDEVLNVKSVLAPTKLIQGDDLVIEFCREPLERIVATNNIRTFYLDQDGKEVAVSQRNLPDGIEYEPVDGGCVPLVIFAENQPQELGLYRFCQRFEFPLRGHEKIATFCSTQYEVVVPQT